MTMKRSIYSNRTVSTLVHVNSWHLLTPYRYSYITTAHNSESSYIAAHARAWYVAIIMQLRYNEYDVIVN